MSRIDGSVRPIRECEDLGLNREQRKHALLSTSLKSGKVVRNLLVAVVEVISVRSCDTQKSVSARLSDRSARHQGRYALPLIHARIIAIEPVGKCVSLSDELRQSLGDALDLADAGVEVALDE